MKKLLTTSLALLSVALALPAVAVPTDIPPRPTYTVSVPGIPLRSTTEVTVGTNGVIARFSAQGAAGTLTPNFTTGISGIVYPSRLQVVMIDVTTNDTLACTSVTILGRDQFGNAVSETVSTVNETAQTTNRAFASVSRISGVACGGGTEAGDYLRISTSFSLALPVKIRSYRDIQSACFVDASASNDVICYSGADLNTAGAIYTTVAITGGSVNSYVVDMVDAQLATAMADGDSFTMRIYVPDSLP